MKNTWNIDSATPTQFVYTKDNNTVVICLDAFRDIKAITVNGKSIDHTKVNNVNEAYELYLTNYPKMTIEVVAHS